MMSGIEQLIGRYKKLTDQERRSYNEEQTKTHFIRPLFEALRWNFEDDVWPETDVSGQRVDYAFKFNGITKFFLEAKPLRADLDNEQYARQAINYAWNKGVSWAVLTDFENVKVFNALVESRSLLDKLVFEITWEHFIEDFERLSLLSRESFQRNALDDYAIKFGKMRKRLAVNEKLFVDLKEARALITEGFARWNKDVSQELLEEGVQRILDRLVFIRVLEDRKLEDSVLIPILREWEKNKSQQLFHMLANKFRELDDTYNSNLFSPHVCEQWEEYSVPWNKVFHLLYGSQVYQYDFSQIPADILGGVYESYLSYIAQNPILTKVDNKKGKLLTVEDKGEVKEKSRRKRKEQGIYYTPHYIVDFIVQHTLGEKLKEIKTVQELKKIAILDPACGSGSFLTAALKAMNEKYHEFGNPANQYTKSEIILTNIYGVDLDSQAVELAKLNLLIETLDQKAKLPDLTTHIRVGNSLINGSDKELKKYFGNTWRDKNPFDWYVEFFEVFNHGGFDVIIGNPPWGANIDKDADYFGEKYPQSTKAHKDTYKLFIDRALSLLRPGGLLGFIVPNSFLYQPRYQDIKDLLARYDHYALNLGEKIFKGVELPSCILIVAKKEGKCRFVGDLTKTDRELLPVAVSGFDQAQAQRSEGVKKSVFKNTGVRFDEVFQMKDAGVKHQRVNIGKQQKGESDLRQRIYCDRKSARNGDKGLLIGSDINRYIINNEPNFFLRKNYTELLHENEIVYFDNEMMNIQRKILWRQTSDSIKAMLVENLWFANTLQVAILKPAYVDKVDLLYVLAIFNSKYIDYLYRQRVLETGRVFPQVKLKYLRDLPFVIGTKSQQKELSSMTEKMILLTKELKDIPENSDKRQNMKREIERLDKQIDERVYQLYELSEDEIRIIESS